MLIFGFVQKGFVETLRLEMGLKRWVGLGGVEERRQSIFSGVSSMNKGSMLVIHGN